MVQSKSATVEAYLAELPEERREVISEVRDLVRKNLPKGYVETVGFGMICYGIPLETYPDTYNGQPLCYVGLAAQKNHYALYLMGAYMDPAQQAAFEAGSRDEGKKLDMGKSCLRFKRVEELPLRTVARSIASVPPSALISAYEASRKPAKKKGTRK